MNKVKYYAVRTGRKPGIYNTWEQCQEQVSTFKNAEYKSFTSLDEAKKYLKPSTQTTSDQIPKDTWQAYVDGSYNAKTEEYSFGGILIYNDKELPFKKRFTNCEYKVHRNVAGEIKGAAYIINYCIKIGVKELYLYYDYEGIEKWYTGAWQANKPISIEYVEFAKNAKNAIKVNFVKVKSHSNNKYNDMADRLAKDALGIN